ncbi:unnamed protein product [Peronospora belbahrii]|uniref:RxLR effector protein n=1 Tax=Peronospora belbahrii TaxID=622444 RepID=A0AAU9KUN6_9STRA|nr:unnamed protein product [Peronospora belbahrii]CAH0514734.1 unnamed protein product [Peronospora belbahrii]
MTTGESPGGAIGNSDASTTLDMAHTSGLSKRKLRSDVSISALLKMVDPEEFSGLKSKLTNLEFNSNVDAFFSRANYIVRIAAWKAKLATPRNLYSLYGLRHLDDTELLQSKDFYSWVLAVRNRYKDNADPTNIVNPRKADIKIVEALEVERGDKTIATLLEIGQNGHVSERNTIKELQNAQFQLWFNRGWTRDTVIINFSKNTKQYDKDIFGIANNFDKYRKDRVHP